MSLFLGFLLACGSDDEPAPGGNGGTSAGGQAGSAGSSAGSGGSGKGGSGGAGAAGAGAGGAGAAGAGGAGAGGAGAAGAGAGGDSGQGGASGGGQGGEGQSGAGQAGAAGAGAGGEGGAGSGGAGGAGAGGSAGTGGSAGNGPQPSVPVLAAEGQAKGWAGIGRLQESMTCTAVLLPTSASGAGPAYVATNGHCVQEWGMLEASNDVIHDKAPVEGAQVIFRYYEDAIGAQVTVPVKRTVWSSMKGVDLAIVELGTTLGSLEQKGVEPLPLAAGLAAEGDEIEVVGAPLLGSAAGDYLRKARCRAGKTADVIERHWHWFDLQRSDCLDIVEGSSGSPVLDAQGKVTGLINTTTHGAKYACSLGAPCEVGKGDHTMLPDTSYTVPLTGIAGCFDAQGLFAPAQPACPLDRGLQLALLGYPLTRQAPTHEVTGEKAAWGIEIATDGWGHLRYKTGPAASTRCREPEGYGTTVPVGSQPLKTMPLGPEEGPQVLCIQGGPSATVGDGWQPLGFVTQIVSYLDSSPPQTKPEVVFIATENGVMVEPIFDPPELSGFEYAVGPDGWDCAQVPQWSKYKKFPISIQAAQLPATFCLRAEDEVGNVGPVFAIAVPKP